MQKLIAFMFAVMTLQLCIVTNTYAAFPSKHGRATVAGKKSFEEVVNSAIERYAPKAPMLADNGDGSPALGATAFGLGLGGLALIVAGIAMLAPVFFGVAAACGIAAIILGILGRKNKLRGMSIAGFVLGIIDVSILLVILAFVILFASLLEK